jgi:BirA family biotin operon repressor/biotin-[acetyl-CoA-carboxylase] ligase
MPQLRTLDLEFEVDSTNTRLLAAPPPPLGRAVACICELQHAGRGRRGRRWIVPFGAGIALSVAWTFSDGGALSALSLAVGVAVSRALVRAGAHGVTLKWPNDIWLRDRKLGGVLIELRAEASGPAHVVIGVGINIDLPAAARREIEASGVRVAAVADACTAAPSRNVVAGAILDELLSMLRRLGGTRRLERPARASIAGPYGHIGYGPRRGSGRGLASGYGRPSATIRVWRGEFARD